MSSNRETPDSDTRAKQLIQDRQERLEQVLDIFSQRAAEVDLTPEMKREIAVHIVNYHRVLSRYEDEEALPEEDFPDISPIRERLGRMTKVLTTSNRRSGGMSYEEVPAVDELDFWYLEKTANDLEDVAKDLGFWASVEGSTHRTEIDDELMEEVEKWQQENLNE